MSSVRQVDNGSTQVGGLTVNTPYEDASKKGVKVEDFLQLMIAQLTNQDFMNPADDTQYVTQLAQFATMQSMQELSHYSQTNYTMSLIGKNVTVASYGVGGSVNKETGVVQKVNLSGDEFKITVNGKEYKLSQIMSLNDDAGSVTSKDIDAASKMSPIINSVTKDSIKFSWQAPISDPEQAKTLTYDVYYTDNGQLDMSTVQGAKKAIRAESNMKGNSATINGLTPGKTYFITVVVRNKNGDEAVYQTATRTTENA